MLADCPWLTVPGQAELRNPTAALTGRPAYTGFSSLIPKFGMENKALLISLGQQIVSANHLNRVSQVPVKTNAVQHV